MRETTMPPGGLRGGLTGTAGGVTAGAAVPALVAQVGRFLAAGGLATACHYALLAALVEAGLLGPVAASAVGYAAAAVLNYHLRRRLVFRSRRRHRHLLPRYVAVAAGGFGLNAAVMALGTGPLALPYPAAQLAATALVTAWNFAAHRLWTFRAPPAPVPTTLGARRPGRPVGEGRPEPVDRRGGRRVLGRVAASVQRP